MSNITQIVFTALIFATTIACENGSRPITEAGHLTIQLENANVELLRISQQQDGLTVTCDNAPDMRLKANISTTNRNSIKMDVRYNDDLPATISEGSNCQLSAVVDTTHKTFTDFQWKAGSKGVLYQTIFSKVTDAKFTAVAIEGFQARSDDNSSEIPSTNQIQKLEIAISNLDASELHEHKYLMICNQGETILNPDKITTGNGSVSLEYFIKSAQLGTTCEQVRIFTDKNLTSIVGTVALKNITIPTSNTVNGLQVMLTNTNPAPALTQTATLSKSVSTPWFAWVNVTGSQDLFVVYSPNHKSKINEIKLVDIQKELTTDDSDLKLLKVTSISDLKNRAQTDINTMIDTFEVSADDSKNLVIESINQVYAYELEEMNPAELESGHRFKSLQWFGVVGTDATELGYYYDLVFHPNNNQMISTGTETYISDLKIQNELTLDANLKVIGQRWNDTRQSEENDCQILWDVADFQVESDFIAANFNWETSSNPFASSCSLQDEDYLDISLNTELNVATIWGWTWQKVSQ